MVYEEQKAQIQQAKSVIGQEKQRIQQERKDVEVRRQDAIKAESHLTEQERKMPVASQRLLRQGMLSGMEGRKRRQIISKIKGKLKESKGEIKSVKGELLSYEKEVLDPFEAQLGEEEKRIDTYSKEISDYEYGYKLGASNKFVGSLKGSVLAGYTHAKEGAIFYKESLKPVDVKGFVLSGKPLDIDWSKVDASKVTVGGKSPLQVIQESRSPKSSLSTIRFPPPRDLGRTDFLRDFVPLNKITIPTFSREIPTSKIQMLTTGSPKRFTPLLSSKPSRPPTPHSPVKGVSGIKFKQETKTKLKQEEDEPKNILFRTNKIKKGKKGKSFWRF